MSTQPKQADLFQAQTTWFHVFKSMIDSGDMAKLPGSAIKVYLTIKAHTNFSTGRAFPKLETVAEKAGLSMRQVIRELSRLEEAGYLAKKKAGRKNVYTLREKVEITDDTGRPAAVATWDYLPGSVKEAVADLKNVLVTGEFSGAKVVHIERLQVNITHLHDNAVNFNVQQFLADLEKLPPELRGKLKTAWEQSRKGKQGEGK